VTAELGQERSLALRDGPEFFQLRTRVLKLIREAAGDEA